MTNTHIEAVDQKFKRAQLALAIGSNPKIDLTSEQTTMLKTLIAKAYGPLVVYRAWQMLDPAISTKK